MISRLAWGTVLCALAAALVSGCAGVRDSGTGASIAGAPSGIGPGWSQRMEDRRIAMERATRGGNVEVARTADNQLRLVIPNDIAFDVNGFAVKPRLRGWLHDCWRIRPTWCETFTRASSTSTARPPTAPANPTSTTRSSPSPAHKHSMCPFRRIELANG